MTTLRCMLAETAGTSKHQAAIIQGGKILLYSEWDDLASAIADRLKQVGVGPGDRVALYMGNDWRSLVVIMGIIRAGAIACPLSTRLPRPQVVEQINAIDARYLVAVLSGSDNEDLGHVQVLSPDHLTKTPERGTPGAEPIGTNTPALILFTSGTGGRPQPAVLTYGNLYYNARGANANVHLSSNERWLLQLPLCHVSGIGIMIRCLVAGATVAIPEQAETWMAALTRYQISHVSLVPAQLADLLKEQPGDMDAPIKTLLVGGGVCPRALLEQARLRHWPVVRTYGMTEMGSQITTMPGYAPPEKRIATSGKLLRHREMTISESGEILVKGPCLFAGYWIDGRPGLSVDDQGWFHTGDMGVLDGDGYLVVSGRKDFLIISGGENIQPEEVEQAIRQIAGIEQVIVVAAPHPKFGQRPVAFVKAKRMKPKEWTTQLEAAIPRFKIPDVFYPWPEEAPGAELKLARAWFAKNAGAFPFDSKSRRG